MMIIIQHLLTVQCCTLQYSAVLYNTLQYSTLYYLLTTLKPKLDFKVTFSSWIFMTMAAKGKMLVSKNGQLWVDKFLSHPSWCTYLLAGFLTSNNNSTRTVSRCCYYLHFVNVQDNVRDWSDFPWLCQYGLHVICCSGCEA